MQIVKGKVMQIVYNYVKELAKDIPIYKYIMNEDEDSIPASYLLIRTDITEGSGMYGDGISKTRKSDCDLILVSKGAVTSSKNLHNQNIEKIKDLLSSKNIDYLGSDLGYDSNLKSSSYTFSISVEYING